MTKSIEVQFDRYVLKAGFLAGKATARAFCRPPTHRKGHVAEAEADTLEAALEKVKAELLAVAAAERADRRCEPESGVLVPSCAAWRVALQELRLTDKEWAMLIAHGRAGARGLTSGAIGRAGGYTGYIEANSQYGRLARKFADHLAIGPLPPYPDGARDVATSAVAFGGVPEDGAFVWVMHEELREALKLEGLV